MTKRAYQVIVQQYAPWNEHPEPTEEDWDKVQEQVEYSMESAMATAIQEEYDGCIDEDDQFLVWARCIETDDQPVIKRLVTASRPVEFSYKALS